MLLSIGDEDAARAYQDSVIVELHGLLTFGSRNMSLCLLCPINSLICQAYAEVFMLQLQSSLSILHHGVAGRDKIESFRG